MQAFAPVILVLGMAAPLVLVLGGLLQFLPRMPRARRARALLYSVSVLLAVPLAPFVAFESGQAVPGAMDNLSAVAVRPSRPTDHRRPLARRLPARPAARSLALACPPAAVLCGCTAAAQRCLGRFTLYRLQSCQHMSQLQHHFSFALEPTPPCPLPAWLLKVMRAFGQVVSERPPWLHLDSTEVLLVGMSSEEAGLRGAKRFAGAFAEALRGLPTAVVVLECAADAAHVQVLAKEDFCGVAHSPELVARASLSPAHAPSSPSPHCVARPWRHRLFQRALHSAPLLRSSYSRTRDVCRRPHARAPPAHSPARSALGASTLPRAPATPRARLFPPPERRPSRRRALPTPGWTCQPRGCLWGRRTRPPSAERGSTQSPCR